MVNFGFPSENEKDPAFPSGLDDDTLAGAFIWTCFVTVHHCVAGVVMVPVVVYGWVGNVYALPHPSHSTQHMHARTQQTPRTRTRILAYAHANTMPYPALNYAQCFPMQ